MQEMPDGLKSSGSVRSRWDTNKSGDAWRGSNQATDNRRGGGIDEEGGALGGMEGRRGGGSGRWGAEEGTNSRGRQQAGGGKAAAMTAADFEAERLAYRKKMEAEKAGKPVRNKLIVAPRWASPALNPPCPSFAT